MITQYGKDRLYARGRMKAGTLNKTESAYALYLQAEKQAGRVIQFWFEAVKLKVADGACWYTPDFVVLRPDGMIELHEVKGSPKIFQDDAKVKVKSVATQFPFRCFVVFPRAKRDGGGWDVEEY
ncbi:MAG: hypothetical protein IJ164_04290 [Duodenibacillus sp.]|nr:hypothetical protein [Duodenibacillus sp.]